MFASGGTESLPISAPPPRRTVVSRSAVADRLIYTDAATSPPRICALRFEGKSRPPVLNTLRAARVPTVWLYLSRHTCLIYGLELLALVAYFEDHAPSMRGICCWIYLDNNCLAALVRGDSNTEVIAILVARFWLLVQRRNVCVWFSRVRSKLNPDELPTLGGTLPYRSSFSPPLTVIGHTFQAMSVSAEVDTPEVTSHRP